MLGQHSNPIWVRPHDLIQRIELTAAIGICLGMQIAVIEYARHVCNIPTAASAEVDKTTPDPVVVWMPEIDQEVI